VTASRDQARKGPLARRAGVRPTGDADHQQQVEVSRVQDETRDVVVSDEAEQLDERVLE